MGYTEVFALLIAGLCAVLLIDEFANLYYTLKGEKYDTILSRGIHRGR